MVGVNIFALVPTGPLALVFTDRGGQVVFSDRNFRRLTKRKEVEAQTAAPLHTLLGVTQDTVARMIDSVARAGFVDAGETPIRTGTGSLRKRQGVGVAAYDEKHTLVGIDLIFALEKERIWPEAATVLHSDIMNIHLQQVLAEAHEYRDRTFLQSYFNSQIDTLHILLARLGGPAMCDSLETALNTTARGRGWPITFQHRQIDFPRTSIPFTSYGLLLNEAIAYASNAVGRRLALMELITLQTYLEPDVVKLVSD